MTHADNTQIDVIDPATKNDENVPSGSFGKILRKSLSMADFHAKACVKESAVNSEFRMILVNLNCITFDSKLFMFTNLI